MNDFIQHRNSFMYILTLKETKPGLGIEVRYITICLAKRRLY